jgi:hypothetical protein
MKKHVRKIFGKRPKGRTPDPVKEALKGGESPSEATTPPQAGESPPEAPVAPLEAPQVEPQTSVTAPGEGVTHPEGIQGVTAVPGVVQMVDPDKLVANDWNPNQMTDDEFDTLVEQIATVGYIDLAQVIPLEDGTYRILGGEHRIRAIKVLRERDPEKWCQIPVNVLTETRFQDVDLQKFLTVRLNVLKGKMNPVKFKKLYEDMAVRYGDEALQKLFAFTDRSRFEELLKNVGEGLEHSGAPKRVVDEFARMSKNVNSMEGLSALLRKLFLEHGDQLRSNFMVFSYRGSDKKILFVVANDAVFDLAEQIATRAYDHGQDVNEPFEQAFRWFQTQNPVPAAETL